ncbi:MAG: hypothetical protein ACP5OP_06795, partial [Leptospirillia bacterium]
FPKKISLNENHLKSGPFSPENCRMWVPDPVIGLDAPVSADKREEAFGRGLFGRKTGDAVDHFRAGMTPVKIGCMAFEAKDLLMAGEGEVGKVLFQFGTDGERATFDPTVALIEGRGCLPRGESLPGEAFNVFVHGGLVFLEREDVVGLFVLGNEAAVSVWMCMASAVTIWPSISIGARRARSSAISLVFSSSDGKKSALFSGLACAFTDQVGGG